MNDIPWACPLDGEALHALDNGLACDRGHRFDRARQGYVNLLAVQHKRSRAPGDSAAMIAARQRFLDAGHYQPLAQRLTGLLADALPQPAMLADAGCGDGYYLHYLQQHLACQHRYLGWDISRDAVKAACRRSKTINWAVATSVAPPLQVGSTAGLLSIFGFQHFESFARVLQKDGVLVLVEAGPEHLLQLRQRIYDEVKVRHSRSVERAESSGFTQLSNERLQFSITAPDAQALADLLSMTPHLYRASRAGLATVAQWSPAEISADMQITLLQKG